MSIGGGCVDEAAVLAGDVDDLGRAGVEIVSDVQDRTVDLGFVEHLADEPAEDVVSDRTGHGGCQSESGHVDRAVGGTATDRECQGRGFDQHAGGGQFGDRFADMVGDNNAGTQAIERFGWDVCHVRGSESEAGVGSGLRSAASCRRATTIRLTIG